MTLAPTTEVGVRGEPGKPYTLAERCSAPGCPSRATEGHHLFPRSYLRGQPYSWVRLPEGTICGNLAGLCTQHHNQVTGEIGGHRAWIQFDQGLFWWAGRSAVGDASRYESFAVEWVRIGPLDPQPPGVEVKPEERPPDTEEEVCPRCGHHKKPRAPAPRRKSKTWTVEVPDDGEVGADNLDEWVDEFAVMLGFDDERSRLRRYHALAHMFVWIGQQREQFAADVREAAEA